MNILWIAAIAIFVLIEKAIPVGSAIARVAGAGLALAGIWLLFK
jgi:predicted metal-binding membrane protein